MSSEQIKTALIITSIASSENRALQQYARVCRDTGMPFILIGDAKSPDIFSLPGCQFWDLTKQNKLDFKLAKLLPTGHYARKNLGYLIACRGGSERIVETDDDNFPLPTFWGVLEGEQRVTASRLSNAGWVNVYQFFADELVWPRGYPLEEEKRAAINVPRVPPVECNCPIQQGLADENPDVDAVYRMTYPLPLQFKKGVDIVLGKNSWSPFNSQNTLWFVDAFLLMYLPSYCSFRMTDIWRSFIAQRIAWENSWDILYRAPTVYQERNQHDLLKDFADEIPGYLNNNEIVDRLDALNLKPGATAIGENLITCYEMMIGHGWVGKEEALLVRAWVEDMGNLLTGRR